MVVFDIYNIKPNYYWERGRFSVFMEERQQEIIKIIREKGKITIDEIVQKYSISSESARRDLRVLEQKGICKKTRGGAILLQEIGIYPPKTVDFDTMLIWDNYREIARKAVEEIRENSIIYLTSGPFGYIMASFLPRDFQFTVIVNSVDIGKKLKIYDNIDVYLTGGKMRSGGDMVDISSIKYVSTMHFDIAFMTGAGVTTGFGLTNRTSSMVAFQQTILQNSRQSILLMPSNKIDTISFIKVCDVTDFKKIITDWNCSEEQKAAFAEKGVEVIVVENQETGDE